MTIINATFNDYDSAIAAAKAAGNDIFAGYENEMRHHKSTNETLGINEWLLTDSADLLFVVEFQGQRLLHEESLISCVSSDNLTVASIEGNKIHAIPEIEVEKTDPNARRIASKDYYLIDYKLAAKLNSVSA